MALNTFVKVSKINNLSDARYCAGMGVHVLGFNLEKEGEHYISPETYAAITGWLAGVKFAAEFDTYAPESIQHTVDAYPRLDFIQTGQPQHAAVLQSFNKPIIVRLDAADYREDIVALADIMRDCHEHVRHFLIENSSSSRRADLLNDLLHLANQYPILLGFGLNPTFVSELIDQHNLAGIALHGGEEVKPGYRNFDELASILEAIEVE